MRWPQWGHKGFSASFTPVTMVAQPSLLQLIGHSPLPMLRSVGGVTSIQGWAQFGKGFTLLHLFF